MEPVRSQEEVASLYRRHVDMVYQICLMLMGNVPDAEDAVQTVFRKVMEYDRPFRDHEHEKAWLIRATLHRASDIRRQADRAALPIEEAALENEAAPQTESDLLSAVRALPENYSAVIHLHYYEGWSTDEIAQMLGQRPGSVRSRLSRAREKLRKLLEQELQGGLS